MELEHDTVKTVVAGKHNVKMVMTSGDARLQWQVQDEAFVDIPSSVQTASTGFDVDLPSCKVKALITGDAQVFINPVSR